MVIGNRKSKHSERHLPHYQVQLYKSNIKTGTHLCGTGQESTFISANNLFSKHIHDRCSFALVLCIKIIKVTFS